MQHRKVYFSLISLVALGLAQDPNSCPGYIASNVKHNADSITADLKLGGDECNLYSKDLKSLKLLCEYQTAERLHVRIYDADEQVYQIPSDIITLPSGSSSAKNDLEFSLVEDPFSFAVTRKTSGEVLFNTSGQALVFESQYLRLRTSLPNDPNIYGLGESADAFRHDPSNYSHTNWNAGEPFMPKNANLYGTHPVYYDHRGEKGTHAVYLHNSNGMRTHLGVDSSGNYLEFNYIGGVFDLYFLSGPSPKEASIQYAELLGRPTMMPYWSFGYHQCRYGYQDAYETAGVAANYSAANIPLETLWNDIDYMDYRGTFSLDPVRFPLHKMQELVQHLHQHDQRYIMMVDPAVAARDYAPYNNGISKDAFLKETNGSLYTGVVWPGPTCFPDWFSPNAQAFWDQEFGQFFNARTGVDIDGLWIDMNEPSNFCDYPCLNPGQSAIQGRNPPRPPPARMASPYKLPGLPEDFQPQCVATVTFNLAGASPGSKEGVLILGDALSLGDGAPFFAPQLLGNKDGFHLTVQLPASKNITYSYPIYTREGLYKFEKTNRTLHTGGCGSQDTIDDKYDSSAVLDAKEVSLPRDKSWKHAEGEAPPAQGSIPKSGLPDRNLISPKYDIHNFLGKLSGQTTPTNLVHANGMVEYDVHSLYGSMMGKASRNTLIKRRPGKRPFIITRSSYAGDGAHVGHWFGDNRAIDDDYRLSIVQMIQFPALYQLPIVGSDVCGFNYNTNPTLCARWAVLGAWNPFYRNHAERSSIYQEFYRWEVVADAARKAIRTRYRLLDYLYTALYQQTKTGSPLLTPLLWQYPQDENTYAIDLQFFYGEALLVSPVTEPNATSVTFYVPNDVFYDFDTLQRIPKSDVGKKITRDNVGYSDIPVYIRGGHIIPMREDGAMTTTALRKKDFVLFIAPDDDGKAEGSLYLDDGESLDAKYTLLHFRYENGRLSMDGKFGYGVNVRIVRATVLGVSSQSKSFAGKFDATEQTVTQSVNLPLTKGFSLKMLH